MEEFLKLLILEEVFTNLMGTHFAVIVLKMMEMLLLNIT